MEKPESKPKLRDSLTAQEREKAERTGRIGNSSARYSNCSWGVAHKYLPSKEQH